MLKKLTGLIGLVTLVGCGGSDGNVSLAVSVPSAAALSAATGELVIDDGASTLVLTSARIVLGEVELEAADGACNASTDRDGSDDDDDCGELELGPFVVDLPLDGAVETQLQAEVPPGAYEEVEFEIDDVDDDDGLLEDYPELAEVSIEVIGTYNGEEFRYTSDLDEEQEIEFRTPFVVDENNASSALTLSIDVGTWFVDANGATIDPRTANADGENEELVEENIEASIEGFEDDDSDGIDDDDDDDDDDD